jgi:hypothetical protein
LPCQAWGRKETTERADRLADQAFRIWPGPVPGVGDEESTDGSDWSVIDAAIEAIPASNWTTHGDLAEVGGTAAQPVGNYCASRSAPANAYRVLTGSGQVSVYSRWTDPTYNATLGRSLRRASDSMSKAPQTRVSGHAPPTSRPLWTRKWSSLTSLLAVYGLAYPNKREAATNISGLQRTNIPT